MVRPAEPASSPTTARPPASGRADSRPDRIEPPDMHRPGIGMIERRAQTTPPGDWPGGVAQWSNLTGPAADAREGENAAGSRVGRTLHCHQARSALGLAAGAEATERPGHRLADGSGASQSHDPFAPGSRSTPQISKLKSPAILRRDLRSGACCRICGGTDGHAHQSRSSVAAPPPRWRLWRRVRSVPRRYPA
jgi:hypothetical protein